MGSVAMLRQMFPPKPRWTADDIPDLSGKVMIVTGGNTGIGKETVKALLQHGAKVYLAARSAERANKAIEDLRESTGKEAVFLRLDLADLRSVRRSAEEFMSKEKELHVLFNNAGVMACPMDMLTAQGYDMQVGTNLIAASVSCEKARVVNTSSSSAYQATGFSFECAKDGPARKKSNTQKQYNDSKLGNILFAREMARRYGGTIESTAVDPGLLQTDLQRHMPRPIVFALNAVLLHPAPMGAITQLWGGVAPETADYNGQFLIPWARLGPTPKKAQDAALQEKLWTWLEEQCKGY